MFGVDILVILRTYLISLLLQLISWPIVKKIFNKAPDNGWVLGRVLTSLLAAIIIWQLGYLGLHNNTTDSLLALIGFFGLVSLWQVYTQGFNVLKISRLTWRLIVIEEYLFLAGFVIVAVMRGYAPSLDSLEKFMDFGFVKQYLVSPSLPAKDMWQAGETINYYSFGHFWTSTLIRIWGVSPSVGYNLMLAFIFGIAMSLTFGLCFILVGKKYERAATLGSLIGALSVLVAGNSQVIWYLLKNRGLTDYWYADATRFIHNTIHEFPSYSFVVSDLHGHLLDLPVVLAFLMLIGVWVNEKKRIYEVLMGLLFGIMMMTNTWDVAVYGLFLLVMGLQMIAKDPRETRSLLRLAITMIMMVVLTTTPWWLSFRAISDGLGVVKERSFLWQLCALWGGGLTMSVIAWILKRGEKYSLVIGTLMITAFLLIMIPEFIFARDIYPNHPRANTMFKLTYQAFIMMGILSGFVWGKLLDKEKKLFILWRVAGIFISSYIFLGTMIFPFKAFPTYYGGFRNYQGIDGEKWMMLRLSENYGAIEYLRANMDGKNLVEAVGDSYTLLNAVSVFSGVPSIEGWRVHEWLWRGGFDGVAKRQADVLEIYQGEEAEKAKAILDKYQVGWILVGQDERLAYKINEEKLWQLGKVVWRQGETYLIRRDAIGSY